MSLYRLVLIVVNPQLWRIGRREKGPETELKLGTYALSQNFSHSSHRSRSRSFIPNHPLVPVTVPKYYTRLVGESVDTYGTISPWNNWLIYAVFNGPTITPETICSVLHNLDCSTPNTLQLQSKENVAHLTHFLCSPEYFCPSRCCLQVARSTLSHRTMLRLNYIPIPQQGWRSGAA